MRPPIFAHFDSDCKSRGLLLLQLRQRLFSFRGEFSVRFELQRFFKIFSRRAGIFGLNADISEIYQHGN